MIIELDGREMTDRQQTHDYLTSRLQLPSYYGRNLDALYDLLTERGEELEIRLHHAQAIRDQLGSYGVKLLETLLSAENDHLPLTVTVFTDD